MAEAEHELTLLLPSLEPQLLRLGLAMLGRADEAEDAVQEALLRALCAWGRFRGEARRSTWIYRIAVRVCGERLRVRDREGRDRTAARSEPGAEDRRGGASQHDLREHVRQALDSLRASHRLVIVLFHFSGLPHAEIASVLGCPEGTAWSRLHAARAALRRTLDDLERKPGGTSHGT